MMGTTRPGRGRRRALALAAGLLVTSGVAVAATGTAQATKGDSKMVVRPTKDGTNECYYRPGQLIAPPGLAATITRITGNPSVKQGASLIPDRLRQYVPSTVTPLSLYSIGTADPFDTAAQMAAAGFDSIAPNYISSFAPVRTWAPGGDATPTVAPNPISVNSSIAGSKLRIGVFDTGYDSKLTSIIPGRGTVSYLPAQSVRTTLAGLGLIEPGYVQPLELSSGRAAGHGTYITGLIRRVAPSARIVVAQVPFTGPADASFTVDPSPAFASNAASRADDAALTYMMYQAFLSTTGVPNVDFLSLSFGSYGCNTAFDPGLGEGDFRTPIGIRNALLTLWERSGRTLTVAAAAGNDATSEPFYPAAFSAMSCFDPSAVPLNGPPQPCKPQGNAVSTWLAGVGSTKSGTIGDYSNHGPWVTIVADGSDAASVQGSTNTWARWSGTSFAAPCAAVFLALKGPGTTWASLVGTTLDCGVRDRTAPLP